jgi:hypothetical protein
MHWASHIRSVPAIACLAVFSGWNGSLLKAQAWTPAKGEGTVSVTYQNYDVAGHYDARGRKNNNGGTQSQVAVAEVDYGITDTIAVTVNLPFIGSKYTGPPVYFVGGVETHPGPLDDGTYHGAFQDLRVDVRRLFWAGPIPVVRSSPCLFRLTITRLSEKQYPVVTAATSRLARISASTSIACWRALTRTGATDTPQPSRSRGSRSLAAMSTSRSASQ